MLMSLKLYEEYLRSLNVSENTVSSYKSDLNHFLRWLEFLGKTGIVDVRTDDIEAYISQLKDLKLSQATISRRLTSLRRFFMWAVGNGTAFINPTENVTTSKVIKKSPCIITNREIQKLLNHCDQNTPRGLRDRTMLLIINFTGLHVSELLKLNIYDFDEGKKCLVINGRSPSRVNLNRKTFFALKKYIMEARPKLISDKKRIDKIFVNCKGQMLSRQGFWKNLKKLAKEAGIHGTITTEALRHSFAVNSLMDGMSSKEVQMKLGHSTQSSVNEYASLIKHMQNNSS